jgi:PleD family two-component response regulator
VVADRVTISLGVATRVPEIDGTATLLVGQADEGLYEAKRKGRNQLVWREVAA